MNAIYIAGRGDAESWPKCEGHPNDPRTEPDETGGLIDSIRIAIARCEETLGTSLDGQSWRVRPLEKGWRS